MLAGCGARGDGGHVRADGGHRREHLFEVADHLGGVEARADQVVIPAMTVARPGYRSRAGPRCSAQTCAASRAPQFGTR